MRVNALAYCTARPLERRLCAAPPTDRYRRVGRDVRAVDRDARRSLHVRLHEETRAPRDRCPARASATHVRSTAWSRHYQVTISAWRELRTGTLVSDWSTSGHD
jgi:hypothetical protein